MPEFKRAEDLFREMRRRRTHMAVVVDEHGGTAGIATIEDALEELLGPIQDEFDEEETPGFVAAGDRTFLLEGSYRLDDIEEQFGLSIPRDEAETIAGHLMLRFGRIPRAYITCLQDRAITPEQQRAMYIAAGCEPVAT